MHWTKNKAQRDEFFDLVGQEVEREARYQKRRYGVHSHDWQDIASEIKCALLKKIEDLAPNEPFEGATPTAAARYLIDHYRIRELARTIARRLGRKESNQASMLRGIRVPALSQEEQTQLTEITQHIETAKYINEMAKRAKLPPNGAEIFRLESCRRSGIGEMEDGFDEAAHEAGVEPETLRGYMGEYGKNNRLKSKYRKAWSRAREKVASVLSVLLLTIIIGALLQGYGHTVLHLAGHQGGIVQDLYLAGHQGVTVEGLRLAGHQGGIVRDLRLAGHQGGIVRDLRLVGHQGSIVRDLRLAGHQGDIVRDLRLAGHQGSIVRDLRLAGHQGVTVEGLRLAGHQGSIVHDLRLGVAAADGQDRTA